jgi:translation initiation factor IF-2
MVFNCIRENTSSAIQTNDAKVDKIKNWESEKKDEFISNINSEDINELALLLNNLSEQDSGIVDYSSVNDMVKKNWFTFDKFREDDIRNFCTWQT